MRLWVVHICTTITHRRFCNLVLLGMKSYPNLAGFTSACVNAANHVPMAVILYLYDLGVALYELMLIPFLVHRLFLTFAESN